MKKFPVILFAIFVLAANASAGPKADSSPPNIVLIYVDDVGYKDLGSYGNEYYETPHIDDFLSTGLRFTQAYANAPLCSPSRIALLTGRHSARENCYEVVPGQWNEVQYFLRFEGMTPDEINVDWEDQVDFRAPPNNLDLPMDRKIIPEYFKEVGYFTGFFGKWHVGAQKPTDRGFDEFVSLQTFYPGAHLDVTKAGVVKSPDYPEPNGQSGDYMTQVSLEFVDRAGNRPFFLYMAHPLIHAPLQAEEALIEKYKGKPPSRVHAHPVYAAMMEMLDLSVGQFIDGLRERDLLENTIILFTSDNGGMTGPVVKTPELDDYWLGEITSHYPLRAGKVQLFEGGIRVPMGVVFGTRVQKGTFDGVVTQMDILPTLLDLTGHPALEADRDQLDGKTLIPVLTDPEDPWEERSLFWHYPGYRGMTFKPKIEGQGAGFDQRPESVIRRGDWKLIESLETGDIQLYNLHDDIGETTNVAPAHPELARSMKRELEGWRQEVGASMPIPK